MRSNLENAAVAVSSVASVVLILHVGKLNVMFMFVVVGIALAITLGGAALYWLWLSRGRLAYSDGNGALVFRDSSTGRVKTPAPKGHVRARPLRKSGQKEGYREDGDVLRYRVELLARVNERVRRLGAKLAITVAVIVLAAIVWHSMGSNMQVQLDYVPDGHLHGAGEVEHER